MKLQDISPRLHKLYYFKYLNKGGAATKISFEKTQYGYRLLTVDKGELDVCVDEKTYRLQIGDVLYLTPGARYRLLPRGVDFTLYNLFFSFLNESLEEESLPLQCVFLDEYDPGMRLPSINFEDAPCFNKSGVFKNVGCNRSLEGLLSLNGGDGDSAFFIKAKLLSVFADMLRAASNEGKKGSSAEEILAYIRRNPQNALSAELLSKTFSYHKNHINKLVKKQTGKSLSEYIRYVKIEQAIILLLEEGRAPTEIADLLGYYDYSHFYKAFVAETGVSPTEYGRGV